MQKLHNDYYAQTSALRQQLQSKRYEYNALLTAQKPDSGKIEAVAQEMEGLRQKLDQQRVKFDIAPGRRPAAQEWDMAAVAVAPAVIWA